MCAFCGIPNLPDLLLRLEDGSLWQSCAMNVYLTLGHAAYTAAHLAGRLQWLPDPPASSAGDSLGWATSPEDASAPIRAREEPLP